MSDSKWTRYKCHSILSLWKLLVYLAMSKGNLAIIRTLLLSGCKVSSYTQNIIEIAHSAISSFLKDFAENAHNRKSLVREQLDRHEDNRANDFFDHNNVPSASSFCHTGYELDIRILHKIDNYNAIDKGLIERYKTGFSIFDLFPYNDVYTMADDLEPLASEDEREQFVRDCDQKRTQLVALIELMQQPKALKLQCRTYLRQSQGMYNPETVGQLPLPLYLRKYLLCFQIE